MTFLYLTACSGDDSCAQQLLVGDDFLELEFPKAAAVVPQYDLLIHDVMISCKDPAFPPAGPQRALQCWRHSSSERGLATEFAMSFGESALALVLAPVCEDARKDPRIWLHKLAKGDAKTRMDVSGVATFFVQCLTLQGLPSTVLGRLSRRKLVTLLGWYCRAGRREKARTKRAPPKCLNCMSNALLRKSCLCAWTLFRDLQQ